MAAKRADGGQVRQPGPVRGQAGEYLQTEFIGEMLGSFPGLFVGGGVLLGAGIHSLYGWTFVLLVLIVLLVSVACFWLMRKRRREAFRKGYIAERQIGRALEQAITARGCAVAHNVMGVMDSGDIDHIVVTRRNVWVIETKYRRVPEDVFPDVLRRLHACRQSVKALLPRGTPVRLCLVLAYEKDAVKRNWDDIRVFNNETFQELLLDLRAERNDAVCGSGIDEQVAGRIWQLSRGELPLPVDAGEDGREIREAGDSSSVPQKRMAEVRGRHPKAYDRWTPEDDRRLADLHEAGWDEADLASEFGRKPSAIRSRLRKLGWPGRKG